MFSYPVNEVSSRMTYPKNWQVVGIKILASTSFTQYARKTYSLLDLGGDIGGLSQYLFLIGGLVVSMYQRVFYENEIISALYKMKPRTKSL